MTTANAGWQRNRGGLGIWEHRGKVAVAGVGHSPMDRRWDGVSLDKTLGSYSLIAAQKAVADAGISLDDIDGVISCPGPTGANWAPRPFFAPPYDTEDGLTKVTAGWLAKNLGLKNATFIQDLPGLIGPEMGFAAQAVGDGQAKNLLVLYSMGNIEGRYLTEPDPYARGNTQWAAPWGWHTSAMQGPAFVFLQWCRKYVGSPDGMAPFMVNLRRNGLRVPWGFYTLHEPYQITAEDYLNARLLSKPLNLFDADRPVNGAACYLFTTADRARDMKQPPVYVLNHTQISYPTRSTMTTLEEDENSIEIAARWMWVGSGLGPQDLDVFNPYDGFTLFAQLYLEGFQWHGVKKGEAHDFYAGDITCEGPHPFLTSGGNSGTGRVRTAHFTDCIDQLRGQAGNRQIRIRCETAAAGCGPVSNHGYIMFAKHPD